MKIKITISILFLILSFEMKAQEKIKHFTSDSTTFFHEMESFLTYSRKEDGKLVMDEFSWDWYGGKFSEEERNGVYKITNLMLQKRKRAFPDFRNYLKTISLFVNSKYQTPASFASWQNIVEKLINGKSNKKFTDYLSACNTLFADNLFD